MKKKTKKARACRRQEEPAPFRLARAYGAMLAKRAATELTPAGSPRKKASR